MASVTLGELPGEVGDLVLSTPGASQMSSSSSTPLFPSSRCWGSPSLAWKLLRWTPSQVAVLPATFSAGVLCPLGHL